MNSKVSHCAWSRTLTSLGSESSLEINGSFLKSTESFLGGSLTAIEESEDLKSMMD